MTQEHAELIEWLLTQHEVLYGKNAGNSTITVAAATIKAQDAALKSLSAELEAERKRVRELDSQFDQTISQRDRYHEMADQLAESISEYFGVDIGEHSNMNCPWEQALDALADAPSFLAYAQLSAQGAQEPVAVVKPGVYARRLEWLSDETMMATEPGTKLYAAPVRPAQLTDAGIIARANEHGVFPQCEEDRRNFISFARAIESASHPTSDYDLSKVIRLTHLKAKDIIGRWYQITGFVLSNADSQLQKCIVDESAVRWFEATEFFQMMHQNESSQQSDAKDALADFDKAVADELPCVSTVEYNSHEICKWFAQNVRERIAAMQQQKGAQP